MLSIWDGVDRLLDEAESESGIGAHGLHLLAVRRWRETGRPLPQAWVDDQRLMSAISLAVPGLLRQVREVVDGPIILMKGPEIAALYPSPATRAYGDLDLLVENTDDAQRALVELGLTPFEDRPGQARFHHHAALRLASLPLRIEVHRRPHWVPWLTPPVEELFAAAVPSALGIPGISTLSPPHHAVAAAVHGWGHGPLVSAGLLIDLTLLADRCDPEELMETAERWGVGRILRTSTRAADALLLGEGHSLALAIVGRHLPRLRERSFLGWHASRYLSTLWAPTPVAVARALPAMVVGSIRPTPGESWADEIPRLGRLLRGGARPLSTTRHVDR